MNDLPVIGYHAMRKELWDRQALLVARRKCMAKSSFHVQKRDFGQRSTPSRRSVISDGLKE